MDVVANYQANELELTQKVKKYQVGDQSVLYVYIADTNNLGNAKKAIFFPHVDSFSRLEIKNSKWSNCTGISTP